jgi:RNA polymerase sigma factor (sigma-70 family)
MAADSPAAKEYPMAVFTISSLTLSGSKSDFARRARSHREQTLLAAAKCGNRAAFDQLFQPLAKRTFQIEYRITRNREDAQDALQDPFLRALRHIEAFESRSSFSPWFTSIAINSALMILRKRRNSSEIPADGSGNSDAIDRHWEAADRAPNPARELVVKKDRATDADVEAVRRVGFSDGEIAEIIAHVALNIFTNYFNNTAKVEVDFPKIALRQSA